MNSHKVTDCPIQLLKFIFNHTKYFFSLVPKLFTTSYELVIPWNFLRIITVRQSDTANKPIYIFDLLKNLKTINKRCCFDTCWHKICTCLAGNIRVPFSLIPTLGSRNVRFAIYSFLFVSPGYGNSSQVWEIGRQVDGLTGAELRRRCQVSKFKIGRLVVLILLNYSVICLCCMNHTNQ